MTSSFNGLFSFISKSLNNNCFFFIIIILLSSGLGEIFQSHYDVITSEHPHST